MAHRVVDGLEVVHVDAEPNRPRARRTLAERLGRRPRVGATVREPGERILRRFPAELRADRLGDPAPEPGEPLLPRRSRILGPDRFHDVLGPKPFLLGDAAGEPLEVARLRPGDALQFVAVLLLQTLEFGEVGIDGRRPRANAAYGGRGAAQQPAGEPARPGRAEYLVERLAGEEFLRRGGGDGPAFHRGLRRLGRRLRHALPQRAPGDLAGDAAGGLLADLAGETTAHPERNDRLESGR